MGNSAICSNVLSLSFLYKCCRTGTKVPDRVFFFSKLSVSVLFFCYVRALVPKSLSCATKLQLNMCLSVNIQSLHN